MTNLSTTTSRRARSPATPPNPTATVAQPTRRQRGQSEMGVACGADSAHQCCRRLEEEAHIVNPDVTTPPPIVSVIQLILPPGPAPFQSEPVISGGHLKVTH